jgi:hypothetical protein
MYSRKVVEQSLIRLADADRENGLPDAEAFDPAAEWTVEEALEFVAHINRLLSPSSGKLTRPLTPEESRRIRHEKLRCTADFVYYLERYCYINDWSGQVALFKRNVAQKLVLEKWGELELAGFAIMMLQLKARQLGVSTLTELAVGHRVQFYPDVNAAVASARPTQSLKMAKMMETAWDRQPFWLLPKRSRRSVSKVPGLLEFSGMNSAVSIEHGNQFNGLSRGTTPTVVHLSEIAEYKDPEGLIEASLLRAIHETPWVFVVLEGTADGIDDYLHKKWKRVKEDWSRQRSRMCPIFLPWYVGFDIYPTPAWLRKQPIPADWVPSEMVQLHAERAAMYVDKNDMLRNLLGKGWLMPREQMWYYEAEYQSAKDQKILNKFLSEMPADDMEAFQSAGRSAFDHEVIQIYSNDVGRKAPWGCFGIVAHEDLIPRRFHPTPLEVDLGLPSIPVTTAWNSGEAFRFDLVPVRFQGWSDWNPDARLIVFDPPDETAEYGAGIDGAHGLGDEGDGCVIEVLRKGTIRSAPKQVAEFWSKWISSYNLWPFAAAILSLYSPKVGGGYRQAKAVIEVAGLGEAIQLELRKRGWNNFHQRVSLDSKRINEADSHKLGWSMNHVVRPMMVDMLMTALNEQWVEIGSQYFVDEMRTIEQMVNGKEIAARRGAHDDRFMGLGMVLASMHQLELEGLQLRHRGGQRRMTLRAGKIEVPDDPVFSPGAQATGMLTGPLKNYMAVMEAAKSGKPVQMRTQRFIRGRR